MSATPIDFGSPLGISKGEWTKVLGANLALLLVVYALATICTLCGLDTFLLNFQSPDLDRIEAVLRGHGVYPIVQMGFATVEMTVIASYGAKAKPKWWYSLAYFATYVLANVLFTQTVGFVPNFLPFVLEVMAIVGFIFAAWKPKEKWFVYLCRVAIGLAVSFILNGAVVLFRTNVLTIWNVDYSNAAFFALSVEYDLALGLALGFLTLLIPWKRKGGSEQCPMCPDVSGSSPSMMNSSRKLSKIAKTNLPKPLRRRLLWLRIRVFSIQTIALAVIAAIPWFGGRPVEFALCYASFCLTRIILGFNRSLHFKSELVCITIGALTFWGLTFLSPSAEASIIMALTYGCGLALGFRLYWELHDLLLYRRAAKTDRYAMLYVVFKANTEPKHINGVMRSKGYNDRCHDIKIVQMYMQREKVEYIAEWTNYAKITIEKRLTEIANDLYQRRG